MSRLRPVLALVLSLPSTALAGVWVGTPVSVRLAPTEGLQVTSARLAFQGAWLQACSGAHVPLPSGPFEVADTAGDFLIPAGCWQQLVAPVAWVEVDGTGPSSSTFTIDLEGWPVSRPLGSSPPPGGSVVLVLGVSDWVSQPLLGLQPGEDLWIGVGNGLYPSIHADLSADAFLLY